jgi:hypothetical protein
MVTRRGQALGLIKAAAAVVESDEIGKSPPNINRQKNHDFASSHMVGRHPDR